MNCKIDVSDLYDRKMEALFAHKTQISDSDGLAKALGTHRAALIHGPRQWARGPHRNCACPMAKAWQFPISLVALDRYRSTRS